MLSAAFPSGDKRRETPQTDYNRLISVHQGEQRIKGQITKLFSAWEKSSGKEKKNLSGQRFQAQLTE